MTGDHKTYEGLRASIRAHLERRVAEANKAQRGVWNQTLLLIEAYDALGPWPEPYRVCTDSTDPAGELRKLDESNAAINAYYERAHALGIEI